MQNNKNGMVNESAQEGMFIHAYLNSSYANILKIFLWNLSTRKLKS